MTETEFFPGRVGLQQRVLPEYRAAFVDELARKCSGGLSIFAGAPRPSESIVPASDLRRAKWVRARNLDLFSGPFYLCLQRGLLRWLRDWDPDVLILEAGARNLLNALAIEWMHRRGRAVIGWGLGAPPARGALAGLRQRLRGNFLRRFDAMIAYSSTGAETYRRAGFLPERVFVALNAMAGPVDPGRRIPEPGRPMRLLFVGRLQERKRVDRLLQACDAIESPPEVWIVGDGPARSALEKLAAGLRAKARFLGDLRGGALEDVYRQVDLFVLPGTGGLAVQQAMARGLPVIAAEGDGTQADLVRAENGWLIPGDQPEQLQRAVREALADPPRLRRMGEASQRIIAQEANIEVMAGTFVRAMLQTTAARG